MRMRISRRMLRSTSERERNGRRRRSSSARRLRTRATRTVAVAATQKPLLLNFSPTSVHRLSWFVPYFLHYGGATPGALKDDECCDTLKKQFVRGLVGATSHYATDVSRTCGHRNNKQGNINTCNKHKYNVHLVRAFHTILEPPKCHICKKHDLFKFNSIL